MNEYYTIDDITITKWLKNTDGTYSVNISAPDNFSEDVPQSALVGISDGMTVDSLKNLLQPYIIKIVTATYSARNNVKPIDLLENA